MGAAEKADDLKQSNQSVAKLPLVKYNGPILNIECFRRDRF